MITEPHIPDPDGFYAAWLAAHEGLSEAQSADFNAPSLLHQCGDQAAAEHQRALTRVPSRYQPSPRCSGR